MKVTRKGRFEWEIHCCMRQFQVHQELVMCVNVTLALGGWRCICAHVGRTWDTLSISVLDVMDTDGYTIVPIN